MFDRRLFLKGLGSLGVASSWSSAFAANASASDTRLSVHHEWGKLEEVVVGYPFFRVGGLPPKAATNYYHPSPEFQRLGFWWALLAPKVPFEEFVPKLWARQNEQMNAVIRILKGRGIKVHQVEKIDASELAYEEKIGPACLQQFPRDPVLVVGDQYIELPMFMPFRRKERFPIRRTLQSRLIELNATITAAPEPYPLKEDKAGHFGPSAFLEGGDVFLIGQDIYVGNTGNASNRQGIEWLQLRLGAGYRVHEIKMSKRFLHLDCALSTPRPGLAIVCREAFPDGLPDFIKGWKLIEVSQEDAENKLSCNGLILDQQSIIIDANNPKLADDLDHAGLHVYATSFDTMAALGGGFRCWHHPLIRSS